MKVKEKVWKNGKTPRRIPAWCFPKKGIRRGR
jgi:hypothetical protein